MKPRIIFTVVLLSLFLLSISACITIQVADKDKAADAPTSAPTAAPLQPTAVVIQPTAAQAAQPAAAATGPLLALSNEVYTAEPAGFAFNIPQGWTQAYNAPLSVVYLAPDSSGAVIMTAYHTGTEFGTEAFNQTVQNNLNIRYSDKTDYKELSRQEEEGRMLMIRASWNNANGIKFISDDIYDRRGEVLYMLMFFATADKWDSYAPAFQQLAQTVQTNPAAITPEYMYVSQRNTAGPEELFYLNYPEDWTYIPDDGSLGTSVTVSGFASPDKNGGIFVVTKLYSLKPTTNQRASDGLDLLKATSGKDVRVAYNKNLPDGRIRLDWWSDANKTSGVAWIDARGKYMVMVVVVWVDTVEAVFKPFLENLAATYSYQ